MSKFRSIVENILKENAYTDKNNLQLALNAYDTLLKQYYETTNKYDDYDEFDFESLLNGINYFKIETKYGPLEVIFDYDSKKLNGGWFTTIEVGNSEPTITINLVGNPIFESYYLHHRIIKFRIWNRILHSYHVRSTFIHEFQHYLDWFTGRQEKNYDPNKYFSLPSEQNAYAMQRIYQISNKMLEDNYGALMKYWTPEQRFDFLKNKWKQDEEFMDYYNKLEPKAQKKLLARLYKYFSADFWDKEKDLRIF